MGFPCNVFVVRQIGDLKNFSLTRQQLDYIRTKKKQEESTISIDLLGSMIFVHFIDEKNDIAVLLEKCRKAGDGIQGKLNKNKYESVVIVDLSGITGAALAMAEGMGLGCYQFLKYKTEKKGNTLNTIGINSEGASKSDVEKLGFVINATWFARDLVNEPVCSLNAVGLARQVKDKMKGTGARVDVMNKAKIEALKMGGLLAVNAGSVDPPTFTIIEWKPEKSINNNPIVLVGKGVVFDTGGLNLKPGPSMDAMKSDMSGAAAVAGAVYAIASANLPVYVCALIPATDNRPNGNAYVTGDVITMHNGKTVEVLNTDAEGRMILADALSYASKYKPEIVIDIATLTGAASAAVGRIGIVAMGNNSDWMQKIIASGLNVYERVAEFPFWEDYGEWIKSDIADIKNIGGKYAGSITAGKFLEHFTNYPWVHLDIAGPAFLDSRDGYRSNGGTGVGVRLFFDLVKIYAEQKKGKKAKSK
ncbi:MAG: leucyl aminopeptidase family protein [Bacteroidetes bacterium]|nr:leucyl aminopeptidase family protein [Bacteroidota bacterium]MBU1717900.1 leucyl aminopeptidase family protein [Bacteroidota bacterium]